MFFVYREKVGSWRGLSELKVEIVISETKLFPVRPLSKSANLSLSKEPHISH